MEKQLSERASTLLIECLKQIDVPVYRVEEEGGYLWLYLYGHSQPVKKKIPTEREAARPPAAAPAAKKTAANKPAAKPKAK